MSLRGHTLFVFCFHNLLRWRSTLPLFVGPVWKIILRLSLRACSYHSCGAARKELSVAKSRIDFDSPTRKEPQGIGLGRNLFVHIVSIQVLTAPDIAQEAKMAISRDVFIRSMVSSIESSIELDKQLTECSVDKLSEAALARLDESVFH